MLSGEAKPLKRRKYLSVSRVLWKFRVRVQLGFKFIKLEKSRHESKKDFEKITLEKIGF